MITKLHHIGLVVPSISEAAKIFEELGLTVRTKPEPDPIQKVDASFVNARPDQDIYVELLEQTYESSPITGFLKKRGGGLHHLCFEVEDIEAMALRLTKKGFQMVSAPVECVGFDRTFGHQGDRSSRIAFFTVGERLLIELLEKGERR